MFKSTEKQSSAQTATSILLGYLMEEVASGYPLDALPSEVQESAEPQDSLPVETSIVPDTFAPALFLDVDVPPDLDEVTPAATYGQFSRYSVQSSGSQRPSNFDQPSASLARQSTILAAGPSPHQTAKDLKVLLGSSTAKLKTGARLPTYPGDKLYDFSGEDSILHLEGGNSKARVQLDLLLESDSCVQGGYLNGNVLVTVQKKPDQIVMLADGRMRLIGFECTSQEKKRAIFYEHVRALSSACSSMNDLYLSGADEEGFMLANEGTFSFPFSLEVSSSEAAYGAPKGTFPSHSGVALRYIIMVSMRIKDPISDKKSVAHFYRHIHVWPRLECSIALAPVARPIQVTMSESDGKLKMTVSLHRLLWIAGQPCFLKFYVINKTSKPIKTLTVELYRDTITFRPPEDSANPGEGNTEPTTVSKVILESVLPLGDRAEKGYAGAKNWWTGVMPGETMQFTHSMPLPIDALSVSKGRLLEVSYRIRSTISSASLIPTELSAEVPIRVINFMSLDPPPSSSNSKPTMMSRYSSSGVELVSQPYSAMVTGPPPSASANAELVRQVTVESVPPMEPTRTGHFADLYYENLQEILDHPEPDPWSKDNEPQPSLPPKMTSMPTKSSVYSQMTLQTILEHDAGRAFPPSTSTGRVPPAMRSSYSGTRSGESVHFRAEPAEVPRLDPAPQLRKRPSGSRKLPHTPASIAEVRAANQIRPSLAQSVSQGFPVQANPSSPTGEAIRTPPRRSTTVGSAGSFRLSSPLSPGAVSVKDKIKELEDRVKAIERGASTD